MGYLGWFLVIALFLFAAVGAVYGMYALLALLIGTTPAIIVTAIILIVLLALLNDFRHFDYATEYKYPTVVLDQMKGLLAKYENL